MPCLHRLGALRHALILPNHHRLTPAELLSLVLMTYGREKRVVQMMMQDNGNNNKPMIKRFRNSSQLTMAVAVVCCISTGIAIFSLWWHVEGWRAFPILLVVIFIVVARFTKGSTGY